MQAKGSKVQELFKFKEQTTDRMAKKPRTKLEMIIIRKILEFLPEDDQEFRVQEQVAQYLKHKEITCPEEEAIKVWVGHVSKDLEFYKRLCESGAEVKREESIQEPGTSIDTIEEIKSIESDPELAIEMVYALRAHIHGSSGDIYVPEILASVVTPEMIDKGRGKDLARLLGVPESSVMTAAARRSENFSKMNTRNKEVQPTTAVKDLHEKTKGAVIASENLEASPKRRRVSRARESTRGHCYIENDVVYHEPGHKRRSSHSCTLPDHLRNDPQVPEP